MNKYLACEKCEKKRKKKENEKKENGRKEQRGKMKGVERYVNDNIIYLLR